MNFFFILFFISSHSPAKRRGWGLGTHFFPFSRACIPPPSRDEQVGRGRERELKCSESGGRREKFSQLDAVQNGEGGDRYAASTP